MLFSKTLVAFALAGLASAQIPNLPTCSLQCFLSAANGDGCSSLTDFKCQCSKPQLVSKVSPCVKSACNLADQSSVSSIVVSECSAAGVPISVPPVEASSTVAAGSSSSAPVTSAVASSLTAVSTQQTSAACIPMQSSSPAPMSSATMVSSGVAAASGTMTSTPAPTFTGAASSSKGNLAGVAAFAAAAAYLL